jgi:D-psicose/D-tagatose/L-ribulose 3-epimerase
MRFLVKKGEAMFKYGVHTFIWSEDFAENDLPLIQRAKSLGFDALDIGIMAPDGFPTDQVKQRLKEVGIEVATTWPGAKDANIINPNPEIRKRGIEVLKELVDVNVEIGSKILGGEIFAAAGYLTGRPRTQQEWDWSVEGIREVALYAKDKSDLVLAVETVNRFETHFLNISEDGVKYCQDVGTGNVKVHLDSYHMMREETNFTKAVEVCGKDYLGYVHVCENNRGIPGTGLVPWEEFFTVLKKVGYEGPLTIEAFDPSFDELNKITATWRYYTDTGEQLAICGLRNLKEVEKSLA